MVQAVNQFPHLIETSQPLWSQTPNCSSTAQERGISKGVKDIGRLDRYEEQQFGQDGLAKNSNFDRYEEQQFGQACDSDGSWVDVFELNVIKR